jgi:GH35 family endo-1,4-beta-xylanase
MKRSILFPFILVLAATSCKTITPATTTSGTPFPFKQAETAMPGQTVLSQDAVLFDGPGNAAYTRLADLRRGTKVFLMGTYGDFVQVQVPVASGATGFVWKNSVANLPNGLPVLDRREVPWESFYLPECAPGIYDPVANSVTFTASSKEPWFGTESSPWPLTKPVHIRIDKLKVNEGGYGVVKVLGNPEGTEYQKPWYAGMTRMNVTASGGRYALEFFNGTSDSANAIISLGSDSEPWEPSEPVQIEFDQVTGKSLRVLDRDGNVKQTVDITALPGLNLPDGLFPQRVFYFGIDLGADTSMEVTGLAVGIEPEGKWIEGTVINSYLDGSGLAGLATGRNLAMGTEFEIERTIDRRYCQILERDVNNVTISPNWGSLWLGRGQYNFDSLDRKVNYANQRGWRVLISHLVWGADQDIPDWLRNGVYSTQEYNEILREHITTVMQHFSGRVQEWSIANEVFERSLCSTGEVEEFWYNKLGYEYIRRAFRWAREADAGGILILNSSANYPPFNQCSTAVTGMILETLMTMKSNGEDLVDAVGMQMHLLFPYDTQTPPDKNEVVRTMELLAQTGVKIRITEFDVDIGSQLGIKEENRAFQAAVYRNMMDACLESGVCDNFTTWGLTDSRSWVTCHNADIPSCWNEPNGDPLMFDKNFLPKPAYFAMRGALAGTPWTGGTGIPAPRPEPRQAVIDCLSQLPAAPAGDPGLDLYDGFGISNPVDMYDTNLWSPSVFPSSESVILQRGGRIGMAAGGDMSYGYATLFAMGATGLGNFRLTAVNAFEAQLAVCPESSTGEIHIYIKSELETNLGLATWSAGCAVDRYSSQYRARCSESIWPKVEGYAYATPWQTIEPGKWYTLRIEIDPDTMTIKYFINGTAVGSHAPMNAGVLKNHDFQLAVEVWKPGRDSPAVCLADNVRVGKTGA